MQATRKQPGGKVARQLERAGARQAGPEPRDKRSAAWRRWKLREFRRRFTSPTRTPADYRAGWAEYKALLNELLANEGFWHVDFALALLPHLLTARQELVLRQSEIEG